MDDAHERIEQFEMNLIELSEYGSSELEEILDGEQDAVGVGEFGLVWRDKTGHVVMQDKGGLVAHAGWLPVDLRAGEQAVAAVGLGGVLVQRSLRGHGVGAAVVQSAMDRMRRLGRPVGLLFCKEELVRFYERLGWQALLADVTVDQPEGTVTMPLTMCWTALTAEARPPYGPLVLEGLPF